MGLGPFLVEGFRERAILKNGTDATATIIALRDTRDRVNENPVVELTVEVEAEGLKPYRAQIVTPLSAVELQSYPVGARVRVRYDPEDPSKVALVGPPARIRDRLAAWRESGVTTLICATMQVEAVRLLAESQ